MKLLRINVLEPYKKLHLRDLYVIIKDGNKKIDLTEILKIKLKKDFQERLWGCAKDLMVGDGKIEKWENLARTVKQSKNSLLSFNERSRAKPLRVYGILIEILRKKDIQIELESLEKNIKYIVKEKNKIKCEFPITWSELGFCKLEKIKVKIPVISWEELNKKPKKIFRLKDFLIKVKIPNPYWNSKRKKHVPFKKIGRSYLIDFTKKVYIHLDNEARKILFDSFYEKIPGVNLKTKMKNATKLLDYYSLRTLETLKNKNFVGVPLIIILKMLDYINDDRYNLAWIERNLVGLSSGERTYHKIKLPINWKTKESIILLTSLIGDGGLGFRSSMWAWGVPHYFQSRHKELIGNYVGAIRKVFGINIREQDKIELPSVCGYIVVASGYYIPGHKNYTNPSLPVTKGDSKDLIITCLNWLISDDGTFSMGHFNISSGSYYLRREPLKYMIQLKEILNKKIKNVCTSFLFSKNDSTYVLRLGGGLYAMREFNNNFKEYNGEIFATKKGEALKRYLNNRHFSLTEYEKRYRRRKWSGRS